MPALRRPRLGRILALSAALWLLLLWICATEAAVSDEHQRHLDVHSILDPVGVVGHIGETIGQAGRLLGLRVAETVADLVSSAFHHAPARKNSRPWTRGDPGTLPASMQGVVPGPGTPYYRYPQRQQPPLQPPSVLGGVLKLLGLDSSKLGAIALNGVIFLAQLISSSLIGRPGLPPHVRGRSGSSGANSSPDDDRNGPGSDDAAEKVEDDDDEEEPAGSPLSWILDNPAVKDSSALREAQNPDLSERLIAEIQRRFPRPAGPSAPDSRRSRSQSRSAEEAPTAPTEAPPADTSCIQLLVCRAGPFLRGMQRSVRPILRARPPSPNQKDRAAPKGDPGDPGDPKDTGQTGPGHQKAEEVDEAEQWRRLSPVQRMFVHMPTMLEVLDEADTCVQRFPNCKVSY